MRRTLPITLLMAALLLSALTLIADPAAQAQENPSEPRWFQIDTEVLRSSGGHQASAPAFGQSFVDLVGRAKDLGYNGIVLRGAELNALGADDRGRDAGWVNRVRAITTAANNADLDVIMSYGSIGRCSRALLANGEPDLATAYPVTMQMRVDNGRLVPARPVTPSETLAGRQLIGNSNQKAALTGLERGGQYRVRVGLGGEINEGTLTLRVVDRQTGQILNALQWAKPTPSPQTPSITMAFNAFASPNVDVFVETRSRQTLRTLNITSYSVEAVPTLNGLNRNGRIGTTDALAVKVLDEGRIVRTLTLGNGISYDNGAQRDPLLGTWDATVASWSAAHGAPTLRLTTSLPAGYDSLRLEGWHALPYKKAVSCSWNDPEMRNLVARIGRYAQWLGGDASLLPFDEINTGGAEPADGFGATTSKAITDSIAGMTTAVRGALGPDHEVYIFSDMIDRNTNARPCYEHVVGRLDAPRAVPAGVTVLTWDESGRGEQHFIRNDNTCFPIVGGPGFKIDDHRARGLANISRLSGDQVVAAYYDTDLVKKDHDEWKSAITKARVNDVSGVLYATWENPNNCPAYRVYPGESNDFDCEFRPCKDNLETEGCAYEFLDDFANLWWDDTEEPGDGDLTATVDGDTATISWTLPNDPNVNGTWLTFDGVGQWFPKATTSATFNNLEPGTYTVAVFATRGAGRQPIEIGSVTFTIGDDDEPENPGDGDLTVTVGGTSATATWTFPDDPDINGTWLTLDRAGQWLSAATTSFTYNNLSPGDHTIAAYATRGAGREPILLGSETFTISDDGGDDPEVPPRCDGLVPSIVGTANGEVIYGTSADDVIWAGAGDDTVYGGGGNDVICGAAGNDRLFGGPGDDDVFAGPGFDDVYGSDGRDRLFGGSEADDMWGGAGEDQLYGGSETDSLVGGPGDDELFGGPGVDALFGGADNDRLNGGPDPSDYCDGGGGTDTHVANCERLVNIP